MPRRPAKTDIVAFKVEGELAAFLDRLPNKSEFIRRAIVAQLGMACPLCRGSAVVPPGLHDHYKPVLDAHAKRKCDRCRAVVPFPRVPAAAAEADRPRLEQFYHGGPLYCPACFAASPACGRCDWHIDPDRVADHLRIVHDD